MMASSGAQVLEIDHLVSLDDACRLVPEQVTLWGNLDPVGVIRNGTPESIEAAANQAIATVRKHGRQRYVLSSGCTLVPDTPAENIAAMMRNATSRMPFA